MYIITMITAFIMALGMFSLFISKKIIESPPKSIDKDALHDLEIIVNTYYAGDISIRLYIVLIFGGSILAEITHEIINIGRK